VVKRKTLVCAVFLGAMDSLWVKGVPQCSVLKCLISKLPSMTHRLDPLPALFHMGHFLMRVPSIIQLLLSARRRLTRTRTWWTSQR
jgi:hypothetical protein